MSGDSGGRPEPDRRQVDATLSVVWFGASRETRYSAQCLADCSSATTDNVVCRGWGDGELHQEIRRRRELADFGVVRRIRYSTDDVDDRGLAVPIDESLELTQHGSIGSPEVVAV